MTMLGRLSLLSFDNIFRLIENYGDTKVEEPKSDPEAGRREMRDFLVTHDFNACQSEFGAYALMAMFPREM